MTSLVFIITPILVLFSITSLIVALFAKLTHKVYGDAYSGGLIGGLVVWHGIDFLWLSITGDHTSIIVYIASFLILGWHYSKVPDDLYGAEIWAMIMVFIYNLIF